MKVNLSDKAQLNFELTNIFRPINEKLDKLQAQDISIVKAGIPDKVQLFTNYPNPFNPTTTIRFALPEDGSVTLEVYNLNGQRIRELINGNYNAGYHSVQWDSKDANGRMVASGMYFYVLKTGHITKARKI